VRTATGANPCRNREAGRPAWRIPVLCWHPWLPWLLAAGRRRETGAGAGRDDSWRRRAQRIYERHVAPVLAAAGLDVRAVQTHERGHAGRLAAGVPLARCDMLVLVGGDGTVFDALQARRACPDPGRPAFRDPISGWQDSAAQGSWRWVRWG
jgi:hypothetical protein